MEIEDLEKRRDTLVASEDSDNDHSVEQDEFLEERVENIENESENGHISEHDILPHPSDEDTESLTGSLDGVIGGDEYELTGDDTDHYYSDPVTSLQTRQEKQQMLALKRHLDVLSEQVVQNEYMVSQSRDELKRCHETIETLESELDKTAKEIEEMEIDKNNASLYRLKSHYTKLCNEIEGEQQVAVEISEKLEKAEYTLSLASMEQGRFLLAGEQLEKQEGEEMKEKNEASAARIRKENVNAMAAEKRRQRREKDNVTALRERERKHRHALAMAKKNREQASKFLKETMTRVRRREAEDEDYHRVDMEKRIQNLLSLKANIESNKENLRAVQARTAHVQQQEQMREQEEINELLKEGLNPEEVLTRRKRIRQFEKDKEAFEKRQRERQVEIADKLLREEKQMKKRYQQQPAQLWPDKQRDRNKRLGRRKPKSKSFKVYSGSSSMEYSADGEDTGGAVFDQNKLIPVSSDEEDEFSPFGHTSRDEDQEGDSDNEEEDLAEPEFKGLWQDGGEDEKEKLEQRLKFTNHIPSKAEQEMMEKALAKQKQSIVQKQIAVGREFKGQAFYSKPEIVVFKDFDIGKTYRKKVVLTNVSYTQNFCKYVGMSSNLMDFVDVLYDPPGAMSAGLTCDFTVIFKPMLNEDIYGEVDFLAQTGPFSIAVQCLTKRCQIIVDKRELNFGGQVLGETCKKVVTLINEGALGTTFVVSKRSGSKSETFVDLQSFTDTVSVSEKATVALTPEIDQSQQGIGTILEQATPDSSKQTDATAVLSEKSSPTPVAECDLTLVDDNVFHIGKISAGDVPPFSSVQIEVIFSPCKPGEQRSEFNIAFADETLSTIPITAQGIGVDLPVWVEREVVDLKICMFDRLYQDAIILNNRATSALRLKFEVCKELKSHLELLPKTAYIQAESQFSAQLKFLPRKSLANDCPSYFNPDTGILEAPMTIRVGDQTRPVCFTVRAVLTPTDIEFSVQQLDFGYCTTVESVRQTITMTNKSILPQMYGFCGVPQCLEVQPNDGFGTLLPLESLKVDVIFSAKKAKEYLLDLVCKNGIGTEYHIPCRGIGVYSPLDLSQCVVSFGATAVGDSSNACISVINSHQDSNEYTHDVPRIGAGSVAQVGPTSFEFIVPPEAPITVSPAVGVVLPGEHCNVEVAFKPQLVIEAIKVEVVRIAEKVAEFESKISEENVGKEATKGEENTIAGKKRLAKGDKKGGGKASPKRGQTPSTANIRNQTAPGKVKSVSDIVEGSDEFCAAKLSLLKSFTNVLRSYDIPCFVASGQSSEPGTLDYDARNTLYLKVHCPAVRPDITVISNNGRCSLDFNQVSVGQRVVKDVTIQNISTAPVHLSSSILDTHGPFELLNATRMLPPNGTHTCVIAFSPQTAHEFYEVLDLHSSSSSIPIRLQGKGVEPVVSSSVNNGVLDFGYALVKDSAAMTFKLENTCELAVTFNVLLTSLSTSSREQLRAVPEIAPHKQDVLVGTSNFNGEVVFDCVPSHGCIEPGKSQDFTVTFSPDHASECYADELSIVVSNSVCEKIRLQGKACSNIMFLQGWDHIRYCQESLCHTTQEDDEGVTQNVVLLLFESRCKPGQALSPAERIIDVGCIKSNFTTKRSGDYVFENPKEANEKGFSFDPVKGSVELGHKKQITCRWQPTADQDPAVAVHGHTVLTVKSDVTVQYKILLRGLMVTD